MTDAFEAWIDDMSDEEYEDRLESDVEDGGFTPAQEEIAMRIREPLSESERRYFEREQYHRPEPVRQYSGYYTPERIRENPQAFKVEPVKELSRAEKFKQAKRYRR